MSKDKKSLIDIVIPTAGRFDMLEKCLDALYREAQTNPISIYIVDDFSPAEERLTYNHLFQHQPEKDPAGNVTIKSKRFQTSNGFSRTCNEGAREGKAPLIMFLNDDVELHEGALDKVIRRFDEQAIGVVGIKLMFPPTSTSPIRPAGKVQHIGMTLNIRGEPVHPLVGWSPDHPKCCVSRDMWAVTGACLSIRRNLYNKAGGFDQRYGKGTFEDCHLCMDVRKLGSRVFFDADATGYHYVGATIEKKKEAYPMRENFMIFQSSWMNSGLLSWEEWSIW